MDAKKTLYCSVSQHYDLLVDENQDPVHDPRPLRDYMDQWDGQTMIDKLELHPFRSVLEIGVGTGRLAVRIAPLRKRFCGIDLSPKTIQRAKENLAEQSNVTLYCGDFLTFRFSERFDVIYSSLTFMHIQNKQTAITKAATLLNKGGKFALSTDKNQDRFLDFKTRKIPVYPDNPKTITDCLGHAGLSLSEHYETAFAHIFIAEKI